MNRKFFFKFSLVEEKEKPSKSSSQLKFFIRQTALFELEKLANCQEAQNTIIENLMQTNVKNFL